MKILIIHNFYKIDGGENKRVNEDMLLYQNSDHEVVLYSKDNNQNFFINIFYMLFSIFNPLVYFQVKKILKKFNPEVIHVHNTWYKIGTAAYFAINKSSAKKIQSLHNLRFFCANAFMIRDGNECQLCLKSKWYSFKYKCYKNRLFSGISSANSFLLKKLKVFNSNEYYFFSPNKYFTELTKKYFNIGDNFILGFPNYTNDYHIFEKKEVDTPDNFLLIVGRDSSEKGFKQFIENWDKIETNYSLVTMSSNENLHIGRKNLTVLNGITDENLAYLYNKCIAVVVPSIWKEGFPRVIIEALSVNKPLLVSDLVEIADLDDLKDSIIKINLKSSKSIENALNSLKDLKTDSRSYFLENFTKEKYLLGITKYYENENEINN
jgi:glycosyltransferase involved in cell wall biosynthesis